MKNDASTIHARVVIRLQGPRYSCQNPLDSLRVQPLNYVHNWTSPTTKKEESPYLQAWPVPGILMLQLSVTFSSSSEKEKNCCRGFGLPSLNSNKGDSQAQRAAVQHTLHDRRVRPGKKASGSLYLDELPIQKCKFRDRFNVSIFSLERLSPKGSCHLDESSMNHTLAQKYLIELLMWNASHVQKHFSLNLTGAVGRLEVRNCAKVIFLCPC